MSNPVGAQGESGNGVCTNGNLGAVVDGPLGDAVRLAAQRSVLWCVFAAAVIFPDDELLVTIRDGSLSAKLYALLREIDPDIGAGIDQEALRDISTSGYDLKTEYTRLFDTGASRAACSLNGGAHLGPRMQAMEEVVRFYNHFGMNMSEDAGETPDHISVELEFLHLLSYGEADLISRGEDPAAYRRARRDFIARQPGRWIPLVRRRFESLTPLRYYVELFRLLDHCLQTDLENLQAQYGRASLVPP